MITVTLNHGDAPAHIEACIMALHAFAATQETPGVLKPASPLAHADNPATGAPTAAEVFEKDAATVFGDAGKSPIAPFTAGVNPFSTAPVVTTDISTNPTAALPPAPPPVDVATTVVPPAPPAPPALQGSAPPVMVDARGLPWDERIHASTRTQTQKGEWKAKRGVDDALVADVEMELRARVEATRAPFVPLNGGVAAPVVPPPPMQAVPPAPPAPPAAPGVTGGAGGAGAPPSTFAELAMWVTPWASGANPRLTMAQVNEAVKVSTGLPLFNLLQTNPALIPTAYAALAALVQQ